MAFSYQLNATDFTIKLDEVIILPARQEIVLNISKIKVADFDTTRVTTTISGVDFSAMATMDITGFTNMYDAIKQAAWSYVMNTPSVLAVIILGRSLEDGEVLPVLTEVV